MNEGTVRLETVDRAFFYCHMFRKEQSRRGGFENCCFVEECSDTAKPSNSLDRDSGPEGGHTICRDP